MASPPDKSTTEIVQAVQTATDGDSRSPQSVSEQARTRLVQLFSPLSQARMTKRPHLTNTIEQRLRQAHIHTPVELYITQWVARATLATFVGFFAVATAVILTDSNILLTLWDFVTEAVPAAADLPSWLVTAGRLSADFLIVGVLVLSAIIIGPRVGIAVAAQWPRGQIYKRKRDINLVMPSTVGLMNALSVGGMNTLEIIDQIADSEEILGEAAIEFQRISSQIHNQNVDYKTAITRTADQTPSDQLSRFLNDFMSIVDSGGDVSEFLNTQKEKYIKQRKRNQKDVLNYLQLLGEVYVTLTILPLLLIVILVIMALLGDAQLVLLLLTVYGLLPILNGFYLLMVSTITPDGIGTGELSPRHDQLPADDGQGVKDLGLVAVYSSQHPIDLFTSIRRHELKHRLSQIAHNITQSFRQYPSYTLAVTVPLAAIVLLGLGLGGVLTLSISGLVADPVLQTALWYGLPLCLIGIPFSYYYESKVNRKQRITDTLTDDLKNLANKNNHGEPLVDALRIAGENSQTATASHFLTIHKKTTFGIPLSTALVSFNNKYSIPRVARSVTLIQRAHEASSRITDVLHTAADLSEIRDEIERERRSATNIQVAVVIISFLVFVGVLLVLETFFVDVIENTVSQGGGDLQGRFADFGEGLGSDVLSTLYIHAALLQGTCAGLTAGYAQTGDILRGLKYSIALTIVVFIAWPAATVLV
jgi:flagellar protein FlaJ